MKLRFQLFLVSYIFLCHSCSRQNKLTHAEQSTGWVLLFDGKSVKGWRGAYQADFPLTGWIVKNGTLKGQLSNGTESGDAGDIVTIDKYQNFELVFDWKLGPGGNSGVKYFIEERPPKPNGSQPGYEYQLIDDANYIYNGKKLDSDLKTASLYDVIAARKPDTKINVWHSSKIIVQNNRIEHWLDGRMVLATDRAGEDFLNGVRESKFNNYKGFANISEGHILLQDHGHNVSFKNIKIKRL